MYCYFSRAVLPFRVYDMSAGNVDVPNCPIFLEHICISSTNMYANYSGGPLIAWGALCNCTVCIWQETALPVKKDFDV